MASSNLCLLLPFLFSPTFALSFELVRGVGYTEMGGHPEVIEARSPHQLQRHPPSLGATSPLVRRANPEAPPTWRAIPEAGGACDILPYRLVEVSTEEQRSEDERLRKGSSQRTIEQRDIPLKDSNDLTASNTKGVDHPTVHGDMGTKRSMIVIEELTTYPMAENEMAAMGSKAKMKGACYASDGGG